MLTEPFNPNEFDNAIKNLKIARHLEQMEFREKYTKKYATGPSHHAPPSCRKYNEDMHYR